MLDHSLLLFADRHLKMGQMWYYGILRKAFVQQYGSLFVIGCKDVFVRLQIYACFWAPKQDYYPLRCSINSKSRQDINIKFKDTVMKH